MWYSPASQSQVLVLDKSICDGRIRPSYIKDVDQGRVQQLTGLGGLSIGPAYVRPVSCWTAFIVIQQKKMAAIADTLSI